MQKYCVFFSFLYPQLLIKDKRTTAKNLQVNVRIKFILFPPNLRLEI